MKLIDAIRLVEKPESPSKWDNTPALDELCRELDVSEVWDPSDEILERLKEYPIATWYCTDEHVGLRALYLDGEPVGRTFKSSRKSSTEVRWLSKEAAYRVRDLLQKERQPTITLVSPDEEIDETFVVAFVGQALSDEGFFEGRPVKALVWYDGYSGRNTPVKYRKEGRPYTHAVAYEDKRCEHVLVQDGNEERLIPIRSFEMAIKVVPE